MKKKLKVLVIFDSAGEPPADQDFSEQLKEEDWVSERNVINALKKLGHEVDTLGVYSNCRLIVDKLNNERPDIVFNLVEQFAGLAHFDKNIVCLLEMLQIPFTGCGPSGLLLCKNKGLSKKILNYHRIPSPRFAIFPLKKQYRLPRNLRFPLVVKPLKDEASTGISLNSFVENEEQLKERVEYIRGSLNKDALAEEYIDGKELYVSVIGNRRLQSLAIRELYFGQMPEDGPRMATYKAKWDKKYRQRWNIYNRFAQGLTEKQEQQINALCRKACRVLNVFGYVRLDLRMDKNDKIYILELNPNPFLARYEDFAESAQKKGIAFDKLVDKIVRLGLERGKLN